MLFAKLNVGEEDECDRILSTSKTLLRYHSPGCPHCTDMEPEWNALKHEHSLRDAGVAVVDADVRMADRLNHQSAEDVRGKGVPTIYFIDGDSMREYDGARNTKDIANFALKRLPNSRGGGKRKNTRRKKYNKRIAYKTKRSRRSKRK